MKNADTYNGNLTIEERLKLPVTYVVYYLNGQCREENPQIQRFLWAMNQLGEGKHFLVPGHGSVEYNFYSNQRFTVEEVITCIKESGLNYYKLGKGDNIFNSLIIDSCHMCKDSDKDILYNY
jgi:hypothetical protein